LYVDGDDCVVGGGGGHVLKKCELAFSILQILHCLIEV
jgi:hypothetical protein